MQSVFNSVKGTALGVAEYLTPVLKVRIRRAVDFFLHCYYRLFCLCVGVEISGNGSSNSWGVRGSRWTSCAPLSDLAMGDGRRVQDQAVPSERYTFMTNRIFCSMTSQALFTFYWLLIRPFDSQTNNSLSLVMWRVIDVANRWSMSARRPWSRTMGQTGTKDGWRLTTLTRATWRSWKTTCVRWHWIVRR